MAFRIIMILTAAICLIGCGRLPSSSEASREFERLNPGTRVVEAFSGEGDGEHVYYIIHFVTPPSTDLHIAEVGFRSIDSNRFEVFHQKITEQAGAADREERGR